MSQSLVANYLHIIFSTKDRRPFLKDKDIRERTHAYLGGICRKLKCPALIMNSGGSVKNMESILTKDMFGTDYCKFFLKPLQGFDVCVFFTQGSQKASNSGLCSVNRFVVLIKRERHYDMY